MHTLPDLPYSFDALEPHFDAQTMEIHHDKHHAGYVNKLNTALEGHDNLTQLSISDLLKKLDELPEEIQKAIRNSGGGHFNHSLFWPLLSPNGGTPVSGSLQDAINEEFGSIENFQEAFSQKAATLFGSGWTWLAQNSEKKLSIIQTPNQDTPLAQGLSPIIGLDVWEHAYYLKYQNRRPDYINAFWNVLNWNQAQENFDKSYV